MKRGGVWGSLGFFSVTKGGGGVKWHGTGLQEGDEWRIGRKNVLFELFSTSMAFLCVSETCCFLFLTGRRCEGVFLLLWGTEEGDGWTLRPPPNPLGWGLGIHNLPQGDSEWETLIFRCRFLLCGFVFLGSRTAAPASKLKWRFLLRRVQIQPLSHQVDTEASHRYTR